MVIAIFGESCTGKSTLADLLKDRLGAEVFAGKDYLRLAKDEASAKKLFQEKLAAAVPGSDIVYVISEREQLALVPEGAVRVLMTAELPAIKERFAARMRGGLPAPVAEMLERKHGCFDKERCDLRVCSGPDTPEEACGQILRMLQSYETIRRLP